MVRWRGAPDQAEPAGRTRRIRQQPWTDPRLILGALLVLGAMALGTYVVSAGDSRVGYWAASGEVKAGDPVRRDHLVESRAAVSDDAAALLLRTDEDLPASLDQLVWARDVAAGALVEASALGRSGSAGGVELPLSVRPGAAPDDLASGDVVDVWVGPAPEDADPSAAARAMEGVTVLSTGAARAGGTGRTVLVDVSGLELDGEVVSAVTSRHVTLVRRS